MSQESKIEELKSNPQQEKQFNEVAKAIHGAIEAEFPTFIKLVQFDVMKELQGLAAKDGVSAEKSWEKELTGTLDQVVSQIGKDLETAIKEKFEGIQKA